MYVGQKLFSNMLEKDFAAVFSTIQTNDSFHEGWKELTRLPKKGNHNPNWRDCLMYIEKVVEYNLTHHACPILPIEARMDDMRWKYSARDYWFLMLQVCLIYKHFTKMNVKPCKSSINYLFNSSLIDTHDNNFDYLMEVICNRYSDTQAEKVELSNA